MKQNKLYLILILISFISCTKSEDSKLYVEKVEKRNALELAKINEVWTFIIPNASPEVKQTLANWKEWDTFEQELKQKPKTSINAFKLKVTNLVSKSDSLHLSVPLLFNKPQVRSRIVALQTKIMALETYFSLDIIPNDKIATIVKDINRENTAFFVQCEEILIKNRIPKEIGEQEMISALDTTRNAKSINFDELELKEQEPKK